MYPIKKIVGLLTEPGVIILLLLLYGFARLVISRGFSKKGWLSLGLGLACFYLFTTAPLPNYLLGLLESRYAPVSAYMTWETNDGDCEPRAWAISNVVSHAACLKAPPRYLYDTAGRMAPVQMWGMDE
jgi:hypothetical protein